MCTLRYTVTHAYSNVAKVEIGISAISVADVTYAKSPINQARVRLFCRSSSELSGLVFV